MRNLVFEFKVAVLSENIYIIINNSILYQSLDKPQMSSYKLFLTLDEILYIFQTHTVLQNTVYVDLNL